MSVPSAHDLFERHHLAVYRYFSRMTGQHQLAQDLTQEVFLRVARGVRAYRGEAPPRAWVFRIVRNILQDHWRSQRRMPDESSLSDADYLTVGPTQALASDLNDALARLAPLDRELFLAREAMGLDYDELAAVFAGRAENLRARLYRIRCALKAMLSDRNETDRERHDERKEHGVLPFGDSVGPHRRGSRRS